jgi:hypothetical protein
LPRRSGHRQTDIRFPVLFLFQIEAREARALDITGRALAIGKSDKCHPSGKNLFFQANKTAIGDIVPRAIGSREDGASEEVA